MGILSGGDGANSGDAQLRKQFSRPSFFDVSYPLASATITNGGVLITSTGADYFGFSILATSAGATIRVYDATTAAGKLLDIMIVAANTGLNNQRTIPVRARVGIYSSITLGTGAQGVVMYAPKG